MADDTFWRACSVSINKEKDIWRGLAGSRARITLVKPELNPPTALAFLENCRGKRPPTADRPARRLPHHRNTTF